LTAVSASYALTASYLLGYISPFPFTGSAQITGSLGVTGSINTSGNITTAGTLTAQTLVVSTISSSVEYSSGSNIFGNSLTNVQQFTGSLRVTGSGNHWILGGQLGIGVVDPSYTVDTQGDVRIGNSLWLSSSATGIWTAPVLFRSGTWIGVSDYAGVQLGGYDGVAYGPRFTVMGSGNTGVGLVNPTALFHISGSGSGSLMRISSDVSSSIFFISGSGNIGLGTTTPSSSLTLAGGDYTLSFGARSAQAQTSSIFQDTSDNINVRFGGSLGKFLIIRSNNNQVAQFRAGGLDITGTTTISNQLYVTGSFGLSGSLLVTGSITGSLSGSVTGSLFGTASQATSASYAYTASSAVSSSYAATASYLLGYISPFPYTGSAQITGSLGVTGSINSTGNITTTGTLTAQTLVVQTITSSITYSSGSNIFGNSTANTQTMTGSLNVSGSATIIGRVTATDLTGSLFGTSSQAVSSSYAFTASSAISASYSQTASYLLGYISPFPFSGSAQITGSLGVTGSVYIGGSLLLNQSTSSLGISTQTVSANATSSYTSVFYNYTLASGSNARAGQVVAVWNGSAIQYMDNSTTDIGNTALVAFTASLSAGNVLLTTVLPTAGWTVKTLVNLL
jgi:hypothetical protein